LDQGKGVTSDITHRAFRNRSVTRLRTPPVQEPGPGLLACLRRPAAWHNRISMASSKAGLEKPLQVKRYKLTRESLLDGSHTAPISAHYGPDFRFMTDAERAAHIGDILAHAPRSGGVWVFGYGSLMWNPAFHFAEERTARVHGFHRQFCLWA